MRARLATTLTLIAAFAASAVLAGPGGAAPALAQGSAGVGAQAARARSTPAGGGPYSALAYSQVVVGGNASTGGLSSPGTYLPAPCWLEPRFTAAESYHAGDPQPSATGDADDYWWWFASQQPGLYGVLGKIPGLKQAVNKVFKAKQGGGAGWWWVPSWAAGGVNGFACATGLVQMLNFSDQYLEFEAPQNGGGDTPGHQIDGNILADIARAELVLPGFTVVLNPKPPTPSDVNLPIWVSANWNGARRNPTDIATVQTPAGALWARVTTSQPQLSISVSSPGQARVYNQCGAVGSPYQGNARAIPSCGVTFLAPSKGYTITVTARWTVSWTASDSPGQHVFASPPWPVPVQTRTSTVTVQEVQSVNGPSPGA